MEGKEAIQNIRTALGQLQTSGKEFVNISSLYSYLDQLEKAVPTSLQTAEFQHHQTLLHSYQNQIVWVAGNSRLD